MENNTDKELRDKLQGLDFPFEPSAWEQMESKLEENRKPKGFIWWWFGGVAASLLLVAGMYGYYESATVLNHVAANHAYNKPSSYNNDNPSQPNSTITTDKPSASGNASNPTQELNGASHNTNHQSEASSSPINKGIHSNNISSINSSPEKRKASADNLVTASAKEITATKTSKNEQHKFRGQPKATSEKSTVLASALNFSSKNKNPRSKSNFPPTPEETNITESGSTFTELAGMTAIQANELTHVSDDDVMKKQEQGDINLKKLNKKIFNYSLGASANVTGSALSGKSTAGSREHALAHGPSYTAGFTHDFTFVNRFAITNSLLFSRTSFTVPSNYSSTITELAIPIGLKGYVVSQSRFRFYLGTGIINHIKLKETYTYKNMPVTYNTQTGSVPLNFASSFVPNSYSGASELSINYTRRYYASFYASAGVESIIQKHLVLFAEPLFYMSLQKVGLSNYHQYNLGLNGGCRYKF